MASIGYAVPILASRRMRGLNDEKLDDDMAKTIARVSKMPFWSSLACKRSERLSAASDSRGGKKVETRRAAGCASRRGA